MITQDRLKEVLHYSKKTGLFTWLKANNKRVRIGSIAGTLKPEGHVIIGIDGKLYRAHRLAWLYVEGYFPEHVIDHKKGNKADNRWKKIRHVTQSCNMQNSKLSSINKSGFRGVSWCTRRSKWKASIQVHKRGIHLGYHKEILDAATARLLFEIECPDWHCDMRKLSTKKILKALKKGGRKEVYKELKKRLKDE